MLDILTIYSVQFLTPPSPAAMIRNIVISSNIPILFDISEISSSDWRNLSYSDSALYFRFNNEPLALELTKKKFGLLLIRSQFNILVCLLVAQMLREGLMY